MSRVLWEHIKLAPIQNWDMKERFCGEYLSFNLGSKGYASLAPKRGGNNGVLGRWASMWEDLKVSENTGHSSNWKGLKVKVI